MKFCVIGLGQFGRSLAIELAAEGHEVMALDNDPASVDLVKDQVEMAVRVDATRADDLAELGVPAMDAVIVAVGEDFASSLTITAHLQRMKVRELHCRVVNAVHDHILDLMNIGNKISPEALAARQFAKRLGIQRAIRHFALGEDYAIVEVQAPAFIEGKTLLEADLRGKHRVNLITVRRLDAPDASGGKIVGVPAPDHRFDARDSLILFGRESDVKRFCRR